MSTSEVWRRLLSPAAFVVTDGSLTEGARVVIRCATGDQVTGTVGWNNPKHDLFITVDELTDGVFRVSTWRAGGQTGVQVWLMTYDPRHASRVREFGSRAQQLVERLLR